MRPTPHRHALDESDRIISLGDVRRRRAARSRAPDRHYLAALALVAATAWVCWLVVLLTIPPARLLTYLAFFAPLWIAVSASGAMAAYGVLWRRDSYPSLGVCARRAALAATVLVVNLAILAGHRWNIVVGSASIVAAIAADALISQRSG